MFRLSDYDYRKCDDMVQKINDFLEEFEADQDLTEAAFKFHIEWLFLKRRLKTFQRGLPKPSQISRSDYQQQKEEAASKRAKEMKQIWDIVPQSLKKDWNEKPSEEKIKILEKYRKKVVKNDG